MATPYKLSIEEKEIARGKLVAKQGFKCPICNTSLRGTNRGGAVLDHCHGHKFVRAALCKVCNTGEGVVKTAAIRYGNGTVNHVQWLLNLAAYLKLHETPQTRFIYPEAKKKKKRVMKRVTKGAIK